MKKIVFVFPSQGSQTVGMLKELAGLNKRIVADIPTLSVNDPESLQAALKY